MTSQDISALEQRIAAINQEISKLEGMMRIAYGKVSNSADSADSDDDDDMHDDNSPWLGHLSKICSKLNELTRDRADCERKLRRHGVAVPTRDDD